MRYVLSIIAVVVLAIAAVILIATRDPASKEPEEQQLNLVSYADSTAEAVFTRESEITGEDVHDSVRIIVSRNQRRIEHLRGYDGKVINSQTLSNTEEAYDHFLNALQNSGFTAEQEAEYASHKGVCPFGNRYIYELLEGGKRIMRTWSTTCDDDDGNFDGLDNQVRKLFELQIPNYREFAEDINL